MRRTRIRNARSRPGDLVLLGLESLENRIALSVTSVASEVSGLPDLLEQDAHVRVSVSGHRYFVDPPDPSRTDSTSAGPTASDGPTASAGTTHPLTAIPILHSNPSADKRLYLDFDGEVVTGTSWNDDNNGAPIHAVPYDMDGDTTSFSDEELQRIELIWQRVSEDYSPFDVDVTTEFPGQAALDVDREAIRAIISTNVDDARLGGTGESWFSAAGGVAFIGSWRWKSDTPVWAFYNELNNSTEKAVAEAVSHELGHALGLSHDGEIGGSPYYRGHGTGRTGWAPIMGAGYDKHVTQWSKGDYAGATNQENDLVVITSAGNRVSLREDDHGNWEGDATPLERDGPQVFGSGIIIRRNDADAFSFEHEGGRVALEVDPAPVGPNLDIIVELYNDQGEMLELYDPLRTLSVRIHEELPAGTYYLVIDGGGYDDVDDDGYSDYASIGQYTISGQIGFLPPVEANPGGTYVMNEGGDLQLDASESRVTSGPLSISWDLNGNGDFGDATGTAPRLTWDELAQLDPPLDDDGSYLVAVRVVDREGVAAEETTRLTIWNKDPEVTLSRPPAAFAGHEVVFHVDAVDVPQDPVTFDWNFNDGSPGETTSAESMTHVFSSPGSYTVEVTGRDDDGGHGTATLQLEVGADVPRVVGASIETGDIRDRLHGVTIEFSHDVSATLEISNLLLFNATTNQLVPFDTAPFQWRTGQNVAAWDFSAVQIPWGNYSVALVVAEVTSEAGHALDGDGDGQPGGDWIRDITLTVGGDVNLDFAVDFDDVLVLSSNFGQAGGWSQGDFTRDGQVTFEDFLILSYNFGVAGTP